MDAPRCAERRSGVWFLHVDMAGERAAVRTSGTRRRRAGDGRPRGGSAVCISAAADGRARHSLAGRRRHRHRAARRARARSRQRRRTRSRGRPVLDRHAGRRLLSARRRPRPRVRAVAPSRSPSSSRRRPARSPTSRRSSAATPTSACVRRRRLHRLCRPPRRRMPQAFDRLRGIAVLQLTPVHLVVGRDSGIREVGDLRGRRVGVGPPGSGTALTAGLVLQAFGIGRSAVQVERLPVQRRGRPAGQRARSTRCSTRRSIRRLGHAATRRRRAAGADRRPAIERLRHEYPFLRVTSIPRDTYPGGRNPSRRSASTACWCAAAISTRRWSTTSRGASSRRCRRWRRVRRAALHGSGPGAGDADSAARRRGALLPRTGAAAMMPWIAPRFARRSPAGWRPASASRWRC